MEEIQTCDFGWHTRDIVNDDGEIVAGEVASDDDWTGHGETHHSCQRPAGHDEDRSVDADQRDHVCGWCGLVA